MGVGTGSSSCSQQALLGLVGGYVYHLEAQEDRLSGVMGADSSPDGGRGDVRMTCALEGTEVCRATHGAHSLTGEAGANPEALTQKPGLQTEVGALEGGSKCS